MKLFKFAILATIAVASLVSCKKKGEDSDPACMNDNTTTVEFKNMFSTKQRVVISRTQTPQYVPIDPVLTFDVPAGGSVKQTFESGRWITTWYEASCTNNCERTSQAFRDWEQCETYTYIPQS